MAFIARMLQGEKYRDHFEEGVYACSECSAPLFSSGQKYAHDTPWPAFTDPVTKDALSKRQEGHNVYKVSCAKCGNGLGHEFVGDGPDGVSRF